MNNEFFFMVDYTKEESTMPFNAYEAFVLSSHQLAEIIGKALEADGFDLMDPATTLEGREGEWDYYGKIYGD